MLIELPHFYTKDDAGVENGDITLIFNEVAPISALRGHNPRQAYLTTVLPRSKKGPHLHKKRQGLFICVAGEVTVVVRKARTLGLVKFSLSQNDSLGLLVPPGTAAMLVNFATHDIASILNLPCPARDPSDPDDHMAFFDPIDLHNLGVNF